MTPVAERVGAALSVTGLSKTFRQSAGRGRAAHVVHALRDVTLAVEQGECLGIAGESGSGKSTLARMLVGLETPSEGEIRVQGSRLSEPLHTRGRRAHARRIQMVFQDPYSSLDPRQPVFGVLDEVQQVHFPGRSAAARRERAGELLDAVGLGQMYRDVLPRALSGGQRQRLAIARALAADPAIVVLDEAVSALDVSTQAQILNLLADLRTELGLTYVFISHDLAVVRQVSDRVGVLYQGRLMEEAPVEAIFTAPAHPYTRLLLDSIPRRGMELANRPERGAASETGCLFAARCPHVHDRCAVEPALVEHSPGARARCWLDLDSLSRDRRRTDDS